MQLSRLDKNAWNAPVKVGNYMKDLCQVNIKWLYPNNDVHGVIWCLQANRFKTKAGSKSQGINKEIKPAKTLWSPRYKDVTITSISKGLYYLSLNERSLCIFPLKRKIAFFRERMSEKWSVLLEENFNQMFTVLDGWPDETSKEETEDLNDGDRKTFAQ